MNDELVFQVDARSALFRRIDSTAAMDITYEIPTPTAVDGFMAQLFGIHKERKVVMRVKSVQVCAPIRFATEVTTYTGRMQKQTDIIKGAPMQKRSLCLMNQKWIFTAYAASTIPNNFPNKRAVFEMAKNYIEKGKEFRPACLGRSEKMPSYVGVVREDTKPDTTVNLVIPNFLVQMFDGIIDGKPCRRAVEYATVVNGFLDYDDLRGGMINVF